MYTNNNYWNNIYKTVKEQKPTYDLWLDKYKDILNKVKDEYIIDLGCGSGGDSLYLVERGYKVISCDYSDESLDMVNKYILSAKTIKLDISKKLPFEGESLEVIIADLSLHYFNNETTKSIANELNRVLKLGGYLIGRVNSVNDVNYGAFDGEEIEKNFLLTEKGYKRFFDKESIEYYFGEFEIKFCEETKINKYRYEKQAIEFVLKKITKEK